MKLADKIVWWNSLAFENKFYMLVEWLSANKNDTTSRHPDDLTNDEISNVYNFHHTPINFEEEMKKLNDDYNEFEQQSDVY